VAIKERDRYGVVSSALEEGNKLITSSARARTLNIITGEKIAVHSRYPDRAL
jgi:hypothetical protein